jgi:hypothetical protein
MFTKVKCASVDPEFGELGTESGSEANYKTVALPLS